MATNVRSYSDSQILERVESVGGIIPNQGKYMIVGVQSQEDEFNVFDDKFYVFDGNKFVHWSTGTTNAGKDTLLTPGNKDGAPVWKTDKFYKDLYRRGYHRSSRQDGGMRALIQQKPIEFFRDTDRDEKAEQQGVLHSEIIGVNIHGVDYNPYSERISFLIDKWSAGCQVWNRMSDYRQMISATWERNLPVDYALLKEWGL